MLKKILNYLKADNSKSLFASFLVAFFGFLIFAFLTRQFTLDELGIWVVFTTCCTMFELLRTGLLQTAMVKNITGATEEDQKKVIGSAWIIGIIITSCTALISVIGTLFLPPQFASNGYGLFIKWLWLYNLLSLPTGFAQWYLQSVLGFRQLMIIRLLHLGLFSIFLLANFYLKYGFDIILTCYFVTYSLSSIYSIVSGLSKIHYIRFYDLGSIKRLFDFGKYSMATMLGSTLLRNSDVFIIDSMLGTSYVALYSVPIKIFDVVETFTRSFIYTAMPRVAWFQNNGRTQELKYYLYEKIGILSLMFIPITLVLILFAHPLVYIFGGDGYIESESVLQILAIYMILIPMDRYTGLCLDLFHLPHLNFLKVVLMLIINIITDIIAIHITGDCNGVAFTTTITSICGTILGVYFLRNHIKFPIPKILGVVWINVQQVLKTKKVLQ